MMTIISDDAFYSLKSSLVTDLTHMMAANIMRAAPVQFSIGERLAARLHEVVLDTLIEYGVVPAWTEADLDNDPPTPAPISANLRTIFSIDYDRVRSERRSANEERIADRIAQCADRF